MFCSLVSLYSFSRNSIYSIHYTYYSLAVSGLLSCFFMLVFLYFTECFIYGSKYNLVVFSLLCFVLNFDSSFFGFLFVLSWFYLVFFFLSLGMLYSFSLLSFFMLAVWILVRYVMVYSLLFLFIFFLFMWLNDIITECSFVFTSTEQFSLIYGIKLLILSEFMLFFCLFWTEINFRFILSVFSCFYALPLLSSFCFAIPYTNVIVLLFSSLPIQATIIFYKVGLFYSCIEQLGQTVSCGTVFLVLQLKEFFYSFHSITDCMIGSIFYFTTGLHGFHVLAGLFYFYLILCVYFSFVLSSTLFNVSSMRIKHRPYINMFVFFWHGLFKYIVHRLKLFSFLFYYYVLYYVLFFNLAHLAQSMQYLAQFNFILFLAIPVPSAVLYLVYKFICSQTKNNNKYTYFYIEFNESLFYSSYYWHFVDLIWLIVFILYFFQYALSQLHVQNKVRRS